MVRALLNTKPGVWPAEPIMPQKPWKAQTRRVIIPQPEHADGRWSWNVKNGCGWADTIAAPTAPLICGACKYQVGDQCWVKEMWKPHCEGPVCDATPLGTCIKYRADGAMIKPEEWGSLVSDTINGAWCEAREDSPKWYPSIFLPYWACRLRLEVKEVRVQRVQSITADDALAEGIDAEGCMKQLPDAMNYRQLWDSINAKRGYGWDLNPWVWTISLMRL